MEAITKLFHEMTAYMPGWMAQIVATSFAILCVVLFGYWTLRLLRSDVYKPALKWLSLTGKKFAAELLKALDDPIKYPWASHVFEFIDVVACYLAMLMFISLTLLVGMALVLNRDHMAIGAQGIGFAMLLVLVVSSRYCKAEGNRGRLALRNEWHHWLDKRSRLNKAARNIDPIDP